MLLCKILIPKTGKGNTVSAGTGTYICFSVLVAVRFGCKLSLLPCSKFSFLLK